ncbi:MAG: pyridoxamine 5'-phosphate oxidase [Phycisphaerales bacterium]
MSLYPADPSRLAAALSGACSFTGRTLPEPLPAEPMGLVSTWLADAAATKTQPNPNGMTLATIDPDGSVSARVVLCRGLDVADGYLVFYTNRASRKGRALLSHPRACAVFWWDAMERQVRIEGPVVPSPESESDAYFAARPVLSRVAAWASEQSSPVASRAALEAKNREMEARFGVRPGMSEAELARLPVPRPPHWGGYRLWAEKVELWLGHPARLHDRGVWSRALRATTRAGVPVFDGGVWSAGRVQP